METGFMIRGNCCYSKDKTHLEIVSGGYLVCIDGKSEGVYQELPEKYQTLPMKDYKDCLVIPGLTDLHVHASQYAFRGTGMDLELLEWLNTHAFSEEAKYADLEYAKKAYKLFAEDLKRGATTRAAVFATIHKEGTKLLMDILEETGLITMVGKVNMDRNAPDAIREPGAKEAVADTILWLKEIEGRYSYTKPILTPRFIPSCSDELMSGIKKIQAEYQLPVQSHLSENKEEIAWVQELSPDSDCYGDAYRKFGLFGGECPTIMAHCVYSTKREIDLLKQQGVYVAHCPQSNTNLASGIAPVRMYLDRNMHVGLGSDVAGGFATSIFRAMADAVQVSKLRFRLQDQSLLPLTMEEAFYMGTKGGGSFFGKTGSFEKGYELDAVIIDDRTLPHPQELTVRERLERVIYLSDERHIIGKYAAGRKILSQ